MLFAACLMATSCRKPAEAAKSDLQTAGYEMNTADFFRAAADNQTEVLRKFAAGKFDLKTQDSRGDTALHAAAAHAAKDAARYLLDKGIEVDAPGAGGRTPLMAAILADQPDMVAWLISQGADTTKKDADGFSPLMLAVRENKPSSLAEISLYDKQGLDAALLVASITGSCDCIDVLTSYGASVYARTDDGRTPLMLAAENGKQDSAELLLELGASRFSIDAEGRTAADFATAAGHPQIADLINRPTSKTEIALTTPEEIGEEMNETILHNHTSAPSRMSDKADSAVADSTAELQANRSAPPVSLGGAIISKSVSPAAPLTATAANSPPPVIMRHYRERDLPIALTHVNGNTATFRTSGRLSRELQVPTGGSIPGTTLQIISTKHRMEASKLHPDASTEISVVLVRDQITGTSREWIAGRAATAHDPVALVEDAVTGKRYTATIGQHFRSADGNTFIVADVRPNQIVIEDTTDGTTHTLPLRGTRG